MEWKRELSKLGVFLQDTAIDYIDKICEERESQARSNQRENDISSAIISFIELKADDAKIFDLLQKNFRVDSIAEAKQYISNAKAFYMQKRLQEHLEITGSEWMRYRHEHDVWNKLVQHPQWISESLEKLKRHIEQP